MTKLYILDCSEATDQLRLDALYEQELFGMLPPSWTERIKNTKSEKIRHERICTYLLLKEIIKSEKELIFSDTGAKLFNKSDNELCDMANLTFERGGRPLLLGSSADISISHTNGASVIAVCFEKNARIGIDIELKNTESENAARKFSERYLKNTDLDVADLLFQFDIFDTDFVVTMSLNETELVRRRLAITEDTLTFMTPLEDWTAAEALLKCDGGGFASLPDIDAIRRTHSVASGLVILHGQCYCISYAQKITISPLII